MPELRLAPAVSQICSLAGPQIVAGGRLGIEQLRTWQCEGGMVSQKHQQPERSYTAGNMDGARPLVTAAGGESTDGRISQLEATIQALVAEREQLLAQAQALRTAAEARATQLQAVFDAMADAVFIYDAQGQITEMNAAARELFGLPSSPEYAALPLDRRVSAVQARDEQGNTLPPDEWPQRRILRGEVLKGPTSVDVRIHTLDGHEIQFNQSGAPLYNSGGRIVGGVAVCRDMTERRQLELRTHEALSALLAIAELFVAETDAPAQAGGPAAIDPAVMGQRIAELTARVLGCQRVALLVADQPGGAIRPLATVGLRPTRRSAGAREIRAEATSARTFRQSLPGAFWPARSFCWTTRSRRSRRCRIPTACALCCWRPCEWAMSWSAH